MAARAARPIARARILIPRLVPGLVRHLARAILLGQNLRRARRPFHHVVNRRQPPRRDARLQRVGLVDGVEGLGAGAGVLDGAEHEGLLGDRLGHGGRRGLGVVEVVLLALELLVPRVRLVGAGVEEVVVVVVARVLGLEGLDLVDGAAAVEEVLVGAGGEILAME
jgi:hypothetical protein